MRQSYRIPAQAQDEQTLVLAKRIVGIIMESRVSFRQADDALTAVQDLLLNARPVSDG